MIESAAGLYFLLVGKVSPSCGGGVLIVSEVVLKNVSLFLERSHLRFLPLLRPASPHNLPNGFKIVVIQAFKCAGRSSPASCVSKNLEIAIFKTNLYCPYTGLLKEKMT